MKNQKKKFESQHVHEIGLSDDLINKIAKELDLGADTVKNMENQALDLLLLENFWQGNNKLTWILYEKYLLYAKYVFNRFIAINLPNDNNPVIKDYLEDSISEKLEDLILDSKTKYNPNGSAFSTWVDHCIYNHLHRSLYNYLLCNKRDIRTNISLEDAHIKIKNPGRYYHHSSPSNIAEKNYEKKYLNMLITIASLTEAEKKILDLYLDEWTNKEIDDNLGKCHNYANFFLKKVEKKLKLAKEIFDDIFDFYYKGEEQISNLWSSTYEKFGRKDLHENNQGNTFINFFFFRALFFYISRREHPLTFKDLKIPCDTARQYGLDMLLTEGANDLSFEKYFKT